MRRLLPKLSLLGCILLLGALAGEMVLRRAVPRNGITPFTAQTVDGNAYALRPSFATLYKGVDVRTNAHALRGPDLPLRKPPGELRVAIVGDSVAFGSGVAEGDTIAARLEAALAARGVDARVLNFGVPGYSVENIERVVVRRALAFDPDLVLYVFVFNDVEFNTLAGDIPPDAVIDAYADFPLRSALLQFVGMNVRALTRKFTGEAAGSWVRHILEELDAGGGAVRLRNGIAAMRNACRSVGVPFAVVNYPHLVSVEANPFGRIVKHVETTCRELGVPYLDLAAAFTGGPPPASFWVSVFDPHPNGAANERVARWLAPHVLRWLGKGATAKKGT